MPRSKVDDNALYFTDNGRIVCGAHCGMSARFTGRDISGQRIARVTDADAASWLAEVGTPIKPRPRGSAPCERRYGDVSTVGATRGRSAACVRGHASHSWAFVFGQRDGLGATATRANAIVDATPATECWFAPGSITFGAAKKLALTEAKRRGATLVAVCP